MLGLTNIISVPFNLMQYDYTHFRTGETETKEIKVLVQLRSQQRQDSYASLSGLETGLLSMWHTLTPAVPCVLLAIWDAFSTPVYISESHPAYKSQREISTSVLKSFTIILVLGSLLNPSLSAAFTQHSYSLPCTVTSVFIFAVPSNHTVSSLKRGICLVFLYLPHSPEPNDIASICWAPSCTIILKSRHCYYYPFAH